MLKPVAMNIQSSPVRTTSKVGPLLLLSFQHRDSMAASLTALGWQVEAARRTQGVAKRLAASGAALVLIDARGAAEDATSAVRTLAGKARAMIVLYDRGWDDALAQFAADGATHLLAAPFSEAELSATLSAASRSIGPQTQASLLPFNTADTPRDSLTGLAPAAAFRTWLGERMGNGNLSLLLVNISRFDMINAAFGRETGDVALRALAHRVEPLLADTRVVDKIIARMPGAEFAIALAGDLSAERLHMLAEAIVDAVARPFSTGDEVIRLGCRIGVVQSSPQDRTPGQFIKRGSVVLAEGRDSEAGPIRMIVGTDAAAAALSHSLHADLRAALIAGQIDILFQPQVSIASGRIEGVEALARWQHPRHGEIGAATLFAVAQQSDYMLELSTHIQRHAVTLAAAWPASLDHLRLSVNVTAGDIGKPRFIRSFLDMVDESGFPRERLTVEITESGLMADLNHAGRILGQLRTAGCRVAIDDFGTGYSSLAWLKALPADYLKLDSGLTSEIGGSERDRVVIRAVISMAGSLGLSVIAEGVETEAQRALLAGEGCSLYQGFLCARPLDGAGLEKLVSGGEDPGSSQTDGWV
jgi:diguanylate cyclase (GGDEF)-like protein